LFHLVVACAVFLSLILYFSIFPVEGQAPPQTPPQ